MKKQIEQLKKVFGLNAYEARLYLAALNFEHANLSDLSKNANIPRTAAYRPIQNLINQGLFSIIKIGKRKYYQALSPKDLKYLFDRKKVTLEEIESDLSKNISVPEKKLDIRYYSGIDGVQIAGDIFLDNIKSKTGKSFENIEGVVAQHGKRQLDNYIKRRVAKNIKGRMIISGSLDSKIIKEVIKNDAEELRKTIVVSPQTYPIKSSFVVADDMVVIIAAGNNPFAVLIKNQDVADSFNSIHDMVWDRFNL